MNKQQLAIRLIIRDLFEELNKYLVQFEQDNHLHFSVGDIQDISIDLMNLYSNPNPIYNTNLIQSIAKFLKRDDLIDKELSEKESIINIPKILRAN